MSNICFFLTKINTTSYLKQSNDSLAQPSTKYKLTLPTSPRWSTWREIYVYLEVDKDELNCKSCKSFEPFDAIKLTSGLPGQFSVPYVASSWWLSRYNIIQVFNDVKIWLFLWLFQIKSCLDIFNKILVRQLTFSLIHTHLIDFKYIIRHFILELSCWYQERKCQKIWNIFMDHAFW